MYDFAPAPSELPIYEENFIFFFISAGFPRETAWFFET
jgi:hypothetical protein